MLIIHHRNHRLEGNTPMRSNTTFAAEGLQSAVGASDRSGNREPQAPRQTEAEPRRYDDRYDDGLVHNHCWPYMTKN